MPGPLSPGRSATRRRRLIDGVVGTISGGMSVEHFYAAVPNHHSLSSGRRRRQQKGAHSNDNDNDNDNDSNHAHTRRSGSQDARKQMTGKRSKARDDDDDDDALPPGFQPIDPKADHSYRIAVAKDGSMITAIPIRTDPRDRPPSSPASQRRRPPLSPPPPRASPILYSDARAVAPRHRSAGRDSSPYSASTATSTGWSRRGLLDVRGRQRSKMRLMSGPTAVVARATGRAGGGSAPRDVLQAGGGKGKRRSTKAKGLSLFGNGGSGDGGNEFGDNDASKTGFRNRTRQPMERDMGRAFNHSSQLTTTNTKQEMGKLKVRFDSAPIQNVDGNHSKRSKPPSLPQAPATPSWTKDDESTHSFPILSPLSKFDSFEEFPEKTPAITETAPPTKHETESTVVTNSIQTPLVDSPANNASRSSTSNTHRESSPNDPPLPTPNSFESLLRQRILEIQSRQATLIKQIAKNETIEQTLVSAIDQNLTKKKMELQALEQELKVFQWHLELNAQQAKQGQSQRTAPIPVTASVPIEPLSDRATETPSPPHDDDDDDDDDDPLLSRPSHRQPRHRRAKDPTTTAYDMDSIGDPSLTIMDNFTVDDSIATAAPTTAINEGNIQRDFRVRSATHSHQPVMVTGLDPPARPSPPHAKPMAGMDRLANGKHRERDREYDQPPAVSNASRRETKEPDGPRISAVLRGEETLGYGRGAAVAPTRSDRFDAEGNSTLHATNNAQQSGGGPRMQQPHFRERPIMPKPLRPKALPLKGSLLKKHNHKHTVPKHPRLRKFVHFHLPGDDESSELRFDSRPRKDDDVVTPSAEFSKLGLEDDFRTPLLHPRSEDDDDEEGVSSWQGEHYDVDVYDEGTGNLVAKEHFDSYQWRDKEHHLVTTERYSTENHHHYYHRSLEDEDSVNQRTQPSPHPIPLAQPFSISSEYQGFSSGSVETDPDLSFIHSVAAIVIQTAVRRFLAEIAAVERMYAVQVIQTAVRHWMAQRHSRYYDRSPPDFDDGYYGHPMAYEYPPQPSRSKHIAFRDDYDPTYNFAATEIQRCFRGWWVRDGLEVDHFAANTIQRLFRGWWVREGLAVDDYCATEIQRMVRGHLSRMSYIYDLYCIIVVQSVVRRYIAFYTSAVRLANIIYIQAIYRGYRVRADLVRYVMDGQGVAATLIQAHWRSYDAQMNYINTLADILIVQSVIRRWLVLRRVKAIKIRMKKKQKVHQRQARLKHDPLNTANDAKPGWQEEWQNRRKKNKRPMNSISFQNDQNTNSIASGVTTIDEGAEELPLFQGIDGVDWYDGNKSEASDMLRSWKDRSTQ